MSFKINEEDEPDKWPIKNGWRINPLIAYQLQDAYIASVEHAEREAKAAIEKARSA